MNFLPLLATRMPGVLAPIVAVLIALVATGGVASAQYPDPVHTLTIFEGSVNVTGNAGLFGGVHNISATATSTHPDLFCAVTEIKVVHEWYEIYGGPLQTDTLATELGTSVNVTIPYECLDFQSKDKIVIYVTSLCEGPNGYTCYHTTKHIYDLWCP